MERKPQQLSILPNNLANNLLIAVNPIVDEWLKIYNLVGKLEEDRKQLWSKLLGDITDVATKNVTIKKLWETKEFLLIAIPILLELIRTVDGRSITLNPNTGYPCFSTSIEKATQNAKNKFSGVEGSVVSVSDMCVSPEFKSIFIDCYKKTDDCEKKFIRDGLESLARSWGKLFEEMTNKSSVKPSYKFWPLLFMWTLESFCKRDQMITNLINTLNDDSNWNYFTTSRTINVYIANNNITKREEVMFSFGYVSSWSYIGVDNLFFCEEFGKMFNDRIREVTNVINLCSVLYGYSEPRYNHITKWLKCSATEKYAVQNNLTNILDVWNPTILDDDDWVIVKV